MIKRSKKKLIIYKLFLAFANPKSGTICVLIWKVVSFKVKLNSISLWHHLSFCFVLFECTHSSSWNRSKIETRRMISIRAFIGMANWNSRKIVVGTYNLHVHNVTKPIFFVCYYYLPWKTMFKTVYNKRNRKKWTTHEIVLQLNKRQENVASQQSYKWSFLRCVCALLLLFFCWLLFEKVNVSISLLSISFLWSSDIYYNSCNGNNNNSNGKKSSIFKWLLSSVFLSHNFCRCCCYFSMFSFSAKRKKKKNFPFQLW